MSADPGDEHVERDRPRFRFTYGGVKVFYPRSLFETRAAPLPDHDPGDEQSRWRPLTAEEQGALF